jgi:hypothetical protein
VARPPGAERKRLSLGLAGMAGAMVAAFVGTAGVVVAQRKLWYVHA